MIEERKRKIIMWDDAGFWMHSPDSTEKIMEDATKLFEDFKNNMDSPDLMWTSSYTALRKIHIRNIFLIGLVMLIKRIDRLND